MIGRTVWMLRRPSRRTRRLTRAGLGVLVILSVVSALAPRPARRSGAPAKEPTRTLTTPRRPPGSAPVSASELNDARRVAGRFLAGYLPFLYGRGSARSIGGITDALRSRLSHTRALVTPVEPARHPRIVSLTATGESPGVVLATALEADGGVMTYPLRIALERGRDSWLVSGVDGG
jgi:hypothetical protein